MADGAKESCRRQDAVEIRARAGGLPAKIALRYSALCDRTIGPRSSDRAITDESQEKRRAILCPSSQLFEGSETGRPFRHGDTRHFSIQSIGEPIIQVLISKKIIIIKSNRIIALQELIAGSIN